MATELNTAEKKVADKAKQMLETELRRNVHSFKEHMRTSSRVEGGKYKQPLKDFKVSRRGKNSIRKNGTKHYYFNALTLQMGKHGFIQNHGANTVRATHIVEREKPHPSHYVRRHHNYKLPKTEFIDKAIKSSGIIPYVAKEIGEIRGYAVLQYLIDEIVEEVNN